MSLQEKGTIYRDLSLKVNRLISMKDAHAAALQATEADLAVAIAERDIARSNLLAAARTLPTAQIGEDHEQIG